MKPKTYKSKKWRIIKVKTITDKLRKLLEVEEIVINASMCWFDKIRNHKNIEEWILPNQKMNRIQILRELEMTPDDNTNEKKSLSDDEKVILDEYKDIRRKEVREWLKVRAEDYLSDVFKDKHHLDVDKKSRLALDVLKATDRDYNQSISSPININLQELPLWEWLLEAQRRLVLELWITKETLNDIV